MSQNTVVVRKLAKPECWDFLGRTSFARLAYHLRGKTISDERPKGDKTSSTLIQKTG
jgi:hypothetical protein